VQLCGLVLTSSSSAGYCCIFLHHRFQYGIIHVHSPAENCVLIFLWNKVTSYYKNGRFISSFCVGMVASFIRIPCNN